ncbi:hypothetical protein ACLKA7_000813 [Drosophila subpalustris]
MDRNFSILMDEERFREDIKKQLFEINNQLTDLRNILAKTNARQLALQELLQKNMTLPESEFPLSSEEAMRDVDAKIRNCPNNYEVQEKLPWINLQALTTLCTKPQKRTTEILMITGKASEKLF